MWGVEISSGLSLNSSLDLKIHRFGDFFKDTGTNQNNFPVKLKS